MANIYNQTKLPLGPFLSNSSPYGPVTGATPVVTLYLSNGTSVPVAGSPTATDGNGISWYTFQASDVAVPGNVKIIATITGGVEYLENDVIVTSGGSSGGGGGGSPAPMTTSFGLLQQKLGRFLFGQ